MNLGTRWAAGQPAPARLDASVHALIGEVEAAGDVSGAFWTLTWLEGRPVLDLDTGVGIRVDATGRARVVAAGETPDEEDDW